MIKNINSHNELVEQLNKDKTYVLLYKKGSDISECSYKNIIESIRSIADVNIMSVDVNVVRDIHIVYNITSVPSLLIFNNDKFEKSIKGCNDISYYESLFKNSLFISKSNNKDVQKRVIVYSTPTCTWCNTLKNHLKINGIKYTDIDISKDQKLAQDMVRKSGQQGVPQTDINGKIILGFDKPKINKLLGIK